MKRVFKIILTIIIVLLISSIMLYFLIKEDRIPNPFLDTKDLICIRGRMEPDVYTHQNIITIKFNKKAFVKNINEVGEYTFFDNEVAKLFYNNFKKSIGKDWDKVLNLEGNVLSIKINNTEEIIDFKKISKKEIKNKYEEYGYECK